MYNTIIYIFSPTTPCQKKKKKKKISSIFFYENLALKGYKNLITRQEITSDLKYTSEDKISAFTSLRPFF